jgi:Tc5 transposase DNA-binding domain
MSYSKAAAKWNVGQTTLFKVVKCPNRRLEKQSSIMSEDDEKALAWWIDECYKRARPRSRQDVMNEAHTLLLRKNQEALKPGYKWLKGFMKRQKIEQRLAQQFPKASATLNQENIVNHSANDSLKNFVKVENPQLELPTEFMLKKDANQVSSSNREQLKSPLFHVEPKVQACGFTPKEITYLYDERNGKSVNRCCLCLSSSDKSFSSVFSNNGDSALKIFLISGVKVSNTVS